MSAVCAPNTLQIFLETTIFSARRVNNDKNLIQNSLTFHWLDKKNRFSLTQIKIPWLFPDLEGKSFFPDFSLTRAQELWVWKPGFKFNVLQHFSAELVLPEVSVKTSHVLTLQCLCKICYWLRMIIGYQNNSCNWRLEKKRSTRTRVGICHFHAVLSCYNFFHLLETWYG